MSSNNSYSAANSHGQQDDDDNHNGDQYDQSQQFPMPYDHHLKEPFATYSQLTLAFILCLKA
jgi:hypothetical protein